MLTEDPKHARKGTTKVRLQQKADSNFVEKEHKSVETFQEKESD